MIPLVVASESGRWLNRIHVIPGRGCVRGVVGPFFSDLPVWAAVKKERVSRSDLGRSAAAGESPVDENTFSAVEGSRVTAGPWNPL